MKVRGPAYSSCAVYLGPAGATCSNIACAPAFSRKAGGYILSLWRTRWICGAAGAGCLQFGHACHCHRWRNSRWHRETPHCSRIDGATHMLLACSCERSVRIRCVGYAAVCFFNVYPTLGFLFNLCLCCFSRWRNWQFPVSTMQFILKRITRLPG